MGEQPERAGEGDKHEHGGKSPDAPPERERWPLLDEHQVKYEFKTKHEGRRIRLTHVPVIVQAYEVTV